MTRHPDEAAAHCPGCGAEYRSGFDTCADDGTRLVPGPAPEAREGSEPTPPPIADSAWKRVPVAQFPRDEEAHLLAGRLRAERIEATLHPEWQGGYSGESVTLPVRVLVPEHRVLEARVLMERLKHAGDGGWAQP